MLVTARFQREAPKQSKEWFFWYRKPRHVQPTTHNDPMRVKLASPSLRAYVKAVYETNVHDKLRIIDVNLPLLQLRN